MSAPHHPTICLNMIVRDESAVITRCLASVKPWIDHWVIADTGSTDGTQALIREFMRDVPGNLHEHPWRDFGQNRSQALRAAREAADYILIIDADEVLVTEPGFSMPMLSADAYFVRHEDAGRGVKWFRKQLVRADRDWRYEGVIHEYITSDTAKSEEMLAGAAIQTLYDGARNRDPAKHAKDVAVLERALAENPDNERYLFYLAEGYRYAGRPRKSIECYEQRIARGGWAEEVWQAMYQIAKLHASLNADWGTILSSALRAYQFRPSRAEPLWLLARESRLRQDFVLAHFFAEAASRIPLPGDLLFVEVGVYEWMILDELAIASYYVGRHDLAIAANDRLLSLPRLPESERERIERNREFSLRALGVEPNSPQVAAVGEEGHRPSLGASPSPGGEDATSSSEVEDEP